MKIVNVCVCVCVCGGGGGGGGEKGIKIDIIVSLSCRMVTGNSFLCCINIYLCCIAYPL